MSRRTVTRILIVYLLVVWTAMLVRCDRFPLTWVPMYSTYTPTESIFVVVVNEEKMTRGLAATHRDGTTSFITRQDLNIPLSHFWRLYYQRMFGAPPAKHVQGNMNLGAFNRWIRGLAEGKPNFSAEWDWRILHSLNKTLGYKPSDPMFIVRVENDYEVIRYTKKDLLKKDLGRARPIMQHATNEWKEEWLKRWNDDAS